MKHFTITIGDKEYQIAIKDKASEGLVITVNGEIFTFASEIEERRNHFLDILQQAQKTRSDKEHDIQYLTAPMPGTISLIKIKNGKRVLEGATAFVLLAMKMQNEIQFTMDAIVQDIFVKEGDVVDKGTNLCSFKSR